MPSLVDHCGSLIIDEVATEECREDSLSLEAALQHHTEDEFSAVAMRATFPGAINTFDGVTDALDNVTITPHQTQRHESWRNHSIRITRSTFSDNAVECQFIGPVADTSASGCIESGDKISFFTRGKMEPSVLEARATEGELTGADPAKATQEENGEKSSSRESDPDDAALGEDDKNITRTRKRESFESTLKLHRTFNNHSLKQRIFIDEPDDRPGAFPAIQDRDGENIDPQPPPQSDTITIGGGWSEEIKKINNKIKTTPTYTLAPTKRRRRSKLPPGRCMKQKSIILLLSNSTKICFSVGGNKGGPAHAVFPPNETPSAETDAVHPTVVSLSADPARDSPDAKMLHKVTTAEDKSRPTPCETFRLIREAIERGKVNCYAVGRFFPSHQSQEWTQRRPKSYLKTTSPL